MVPRPRGRMTPRGVLAFAASTLRRGDDARADGREHFPVDVLLLVPHCGGDVGDAALCASLPRLGQASTTPAGRGRGRGRARAARARLCRRFIGAGDGRARGVVSGVSGVFTRANVRALRRCLGARVLPRSRPRRLRPPRFDRARAPPPPSSRAEPVPWVLDRLDPAPRAPTASLPRNAGGAGSLACSTRSRVLQDGGERPAPRPVSVGVDLCRRKDRDALGETPHDCDGHERTSPPSSRKGDSTASRRRRPSTLVRVLRVRRRHGMSSIGLMSFKAPGGSPRTSPRRRVETPRRRGGDSRNLAGSVGSVAAPDALRRRRRARAPARGIVQERRARRSADPRPPRRARDRRRRERRGRVPRARVSPGASPPPPPPSPVGPLGPTLRRCAVDGTVRRRLRSRGPRAERREARAQPGLPRLLAAAGDRRARRRGRARRVPR